MKLLSSKLPSVIRRLNRLHHCNTNSLSVGQNVAGFKVNRVDEIPELFITATSLTHQKTGADYLHLNRDDANNVFAVGFRTIPSDSTGVPHILEHTVLCGSEKYPVRDPFFKMLNRSLSTFMNAMTGPDFTVYPFSTQNEKDYRNLLSVYLDAVFKPRLEKLDFLQEGWRLEPENLQDENSPLVIKGVVFNEMKGVYADPQSVLGQRIVNNLLPSSTYSIDYGGEPMKIPGLTWKQLRDFHAKFYHPSNARFLSYGNFSLVEHLKFLDQEYLSKYEKIDPADHVPLEPKWTSPKKIEVRCREDPMAPEPAKQYTVAVSYSLNDVRDSYETAVLQVISALLMDGPNSPFYKSLLEPNYGIGYTPVTGYDSHTRNATFTVGLQGIKGEDTELILHKIDETLQDVLKNGFPSERVEALLHKIELNLKHQKSNFGLGLAMVLTPAWNHGGDPMKVLQINEKLQMLRNKMKENPSYLQEKVDEYFVRNSHKLISVMYPDPEFDQKQKTLESELLKSKTEGLTVDDKAEIVKLARELSKKQSETEDISILPTLVIGDIDKDVERVNLDKAILGGTPLQLCEQPTNGITYFRSVLSTRHVPEDLKMYLPLFCNLATQMGVEGMDYRKLDQEIGLKTGGLSVGSHICESPDSVNAFEESIILSSYCLDQNTNAMFDLWAKVFNTITLEDLSRLETIVRSIAGDSINSLVQSGHSYAMSNAASSLSPGLLLREQTDGLTFVKQLRNMMEAGQFGNILEGVQKVAKLVLSKANMRCALNMVPTQRDAAVQNLEKFLASVEGEAGGYQRPFSDIVDFRPTSMKRHNILPVPVNYVSKALPAVPLTSSDFAPLRILCRVVSSKYLHTEVREKGGAYGSGLTVGSSGAMQYYSYRDPRCLETLDVFDKSIDWVRSGKIDDQAILEAKLSVFQKVDAPTPPGSKGMRVFLSGVDDDMLQKHRTELRTVTKESVIEVAEKYLTSSVSGISVLGPVNESIKSDDGWVVE